MEGDKFQKNSNQYMLKFTLQEVILSCIAIIDH